MIMPDYNEIKKQQIQAICINTPAIMMYSSNDCFSYDIILNSGYYIDRYMYSSNDNFKHVTLDEYKDNDRFCVMSSNEILDFLKHLKHFNKDELEIENKKIKVHNIRARAYLLDKLNEDIHKDVDKHEAILSELHNKFDSNFRESTELLIQAQDIENEIGGNDEK